MKKIILACAIATSIQAMSAPIIMGEKNFDVNAQIIAADLTPSVELVDAIGEEEFGSFAKELHGKPMLFLKDKNNFGLERIVDKNSDEKNYNEMHRSIEGDGLELLPLEKRILNKLGIQHELHIQASEELAIYSSCEDQYNIKTNSKNNEFLNIDLDVDYLINCVFSMEQFDKLKSLIKGRMKPNPIVSEDLKLRVITNSLTKEDKDFIDRKFKGVRGFTFSSYAISKVYEGKIKISYIDENLYDINTLDEANKGLGDKTLITVDGKHLFSTFYKLLFKNKTKTLTPPVVALEKEAEVNVVNNGKDIQCVQTTISEDNIKYSCSLIIEGDVFYMSQK